MIKDRTDFATGLLFMGAGLFYGAMSLKLPVGSALNMGPGYFPLVLCGILVALGAAIAGKSLVARGDGAFGDVPWRAIILIPLAIVVFGAGLGYLGLLPTVFVSSFIASMSNRNVSPKMAALVSLSLAVFCTLVFSYGIGLHIPVFGSWFVG